MNDTKYFIACLFDPTETIQDGFSERNYFMAILKRENKEFREILTNNKVYEAEKFETFHEDIFFQNNALLYGSLKKEVDSSYVKGFFNSLKKEEIIEYIHHIFQLANKTMQKSLEGKENELIFKLNFIESFKASYENLIDSTSFKKEKHLRKSKN